MKRDDLFDYLGPAAGILLVLVLVLVAAADTGGRKATREAVGNALYTPDAIACSTTTPTAVVTSSTTRPQLILFNNSAYVIYLTSDIADASSAFAIANGIPFLSSTTFSLGAVSAAIDCLAETDAGSGGAEIRVMVGVTE